MKKIENTYGLLLRRYHEHGFECLTASLVRREGDHHAPRNVSDSWGDDNQRPKHLEGFALEGLALDGHISSVSRDTFVLGPPSFKGVHLVDERDARRMVKTLKRVNAKLAADAAYSPEDMLVSLCNALKLSFVVECRDTNQRSSYDDNRWNWMTIGQGRNRYRAIIAEMVGQKEAAV
jgi:hypothetical protein